MKVTHIELGPAVDELVEDFVEKRHPGEWSNPSVSKLRYKLRDRLLRIIAKKIVGTAVSALDLEIRAEDRKRFDEGGG